MVNTLNCSLSFVTILQDLKYSPDENTPDELAKNYKEDGNFNFKCKKYRFAVASYTEGLKAKSTDLEINTQLLTNRAAAQFHIGNYRSSLLDCQMALRFTPDHMKVNLCVFILEPLLAPSLSPCRNSQETQKTLNLFSHRQFYEEPPVRVR